MLLFHILQGVLTEEFILDNISKLLSCLRDANVTIRWLMLHTQCKEKKIAQFMNENLDKDKILSLLLDTAQFEVWFFFFFTIN